MVSVYIRNIALLLTGKEWLKEQLMNKGEDVVFKKLTAVGPSAI